MTLQECMGIHKTHEIIQRHRHSQQKCEGQRPCIHIDHIYLATHSRYCIKENATYSGTLSMATDRHTHCAQLHTQADSTQLATQSQMPRSDTPFTHSRTTVMLALNFSFPRRLWPHKENISGIFMGKSGPQALVTEKPRSRIEFCTPGCVILGNHWAFLGLQLPGL